MSKGILYIMTTSVSGIIKIGVTCIKNYDERMRFLAKNGYANVSGLTPYFAIEMENYEETENLLKDLFKFTRIGDSELYTLDAEKTKQLFLTFSGNVIFPKSSTTNADTVKKIAKAIKQSSLFNMYDRGLKNKILTFVGNPSIKVKVVGEREVEYDGVIYKLSPLALKLYKEMGKANPSEAYQGAQHFMYNGIKLINIPLQQDK